ncbi:MAG: helix-turn-helix domain-containing protein [Halioglobus sp.]
MNSLTTEQLLNQVDAFSTPGGLLRAGREAQGVSQREVADALNLIPRYVNLLEDDDYASLPNEAFARGYIKAYGRFLDIGEEQLLPLYDEVLAREPLQEKGRIETRPLQLQATGMGVVIGLTTLALLLAMLWWWQGGEQVGNVGAAKRASELPGDAVVKTPIVKVLTVIEQ